MHALVWHAMLAKEQQSKRIAKRNAKNYLRCALHFVLANLLIGNNASHFHAPLFSRYAHRDRVRIGLSLWARRNKWNRYRNSCFQLLILLIIESCLFVSFTFFSEFCLIYNIHGNKLIACLSIDFNFLFQVFCKLFQCLLILRTPKVQMQIKTQCRKLSTAFAEQIQRVQFTQ